MSWATHPAGEGCDAIDRTVLDGPFGGRDGGFVEARTVRRSLRNAVFAFVGLVVRFVVVVVLLAVVVSEVLPWVGRLLPGDAD